MNEREPYTPGPAFGARVRRDGEQWTLILVRDLRHPPSRVWRALTDPARLREWAPFDAGAAMDVAGATVQLTWMGAAGPHVTEAVIRRADPPRLLEYSGGSGGQELRWELEDLDGGTRLTLWASIGRRYVAMGAAGWHICLDVLARLLAGTPLGRLVGPDAARFEGFARLNGEYAKLFGVANPATLPGMPKE